MRKVLLYWSKADAEMAAKKREEKLKKAEKDVRYDGYFDIITSELDYDAEKIREVYHGLWRMEESFRIMKTAFCFNQNWKNIFRIIFPASVQSHKGNCSEHL